MNADNSSNAYAVSDSAVAEKFAQEIMVELGSGDLVLPMLPEITLRVSDVAGDPEASLGDLADLIATDPSLSAQLIKVSNSPLYRGVQAVESVPMAVSRLGFKVVKNLVSGLAMEQMFTATSPDLERMLRELWEQSVDVAARCHILAGSASKVQEEEAMLAGLIHNIGALPVLMKAQQQGDLLGDAAQVNALICSLSAEVGVAVLESWAFPESLIEVVAHCQDFSRDSIDGPDLVDVVQVASLQSHYRVDFDLSPEELERIPAFAKLRVQTGVEVEELDQDSEDYAQALALFG